MNKIEILAPAGDMECALAAINAGADAVYVGLSDFSARSSAKNFTAEEFETLCRRAHALGVKIYAALNTVVKDGEVEQFIASVLQAYNAGANAIIIQDIFLGSLIKARYPDITLHLSTQGGACNAYSARLAKRLGFSRVIAARETSLKDLREISEIIECEAFVQGALCTCFSGQCYFSSFVGGNSGNRGRCKQPCRKKYYYNRTGYDKPAYRLSLSDLCVGEDINKYAEAGVSSFKIEGRLRRPEYVAAAVKYYKNLLCGIAESQDKINLKRAYNRGNYTKGLAFGQDKTFISSAVQGHIGEFAGSVFVENGKYVCKSNLPCAVGDAFKILRAGEEVGGAKFGERVKGGFTLTSAVRLKNGDKAFLTSDSKLFNRLNLQERTVDLTVEVTLNQGEPPRVKIGNYVLNGDEPLTQAITRPVTCDEVERCFKKTDVYPFNPQVIVNITGAPYVTPSKLNALRRAAYSEYYEKLANLPPQKLVYKAENFAFSVGENQTKNKKTAVICRDLNGVNADIGVLKPADYADEAAIRAACENFNGEKYLYLPPFLSGDEIKTIRDIAEPFDGIYCEGTYGLELCREWNKPLFAGTGFNVTNRLALSRINARYIALSKELTQGEAQPLSSENTFYLTAGDIKLMDIIYCPFEKTCKNCDRREIYTLTDETGREFPVRRYKTSECRFEIFNCAQLVSVNGFTGALLDCTISQPKPLIDAINDEQKLKRLYKNYTRGHTANKTL